LLPLNFQDILFQSSIERFFNLFDWKFARTVPNTLVAIFFGVNGCGLPLSPFKLRKLFSTTTRKREDIANRKKFVPLKTNGTQVTQQASKVAYILGITR
jgi:hypothetical protein